jgi:hypothetical protein
MWDSHDDNFEHTVLWDTGTNSSKEVAVSIIKVEDGAWFRHLSTNSTVSVLIM